MKKIFYLTIVIHTSICSFGQDIPAATEQQLENLAEIVETETEDDDYLQELEQFRKDPVNLNSADAGDLKQLRILSGLQIAKLISYRNLLGPLISIHELQAIPGWDVVTIKRLIPFVTVASAVSLKEETGNRFRSGEHSILLRLSQIMERSAGYDLSSSGTKYLGSPQRIFFRYRYSYKNLLQFGLVGDKDAGEQFLKGAQSKGFDFYSVHFFARKLGIVQAIALGDFTVNMGQGLIQWQGLAFKKSGDVMNIKRQATVLRPYNSAGEFYFHRGAGVTVKKGKIESTFFFSLRRLSGNIATDTTGNQIYISSLLSSGNHRTINENASRNDLSQIALGGNIIYKTNRLQAGLNMVRYNFSVPLQKKDEPYNLYAISGKNWYNVSVEYSYTFRNLHFFGEAAIDRKMDKAFINGLLLSVDPAVDLSFVYRSINKAFQSVSGNAFTENSLPVNEYGLYAGILVRPGNNWRFDAYADIFRFPWLKYQVDAPSAGKDFLIQLSYNPNRQVEIYSRYRNETRHSNQADNAVTNSLGNEQRQSWRSQVSYKVSPSILVRNRIEMLWYYNKVDAGVLSNTGKGRENGFLAFSDIAWRPLLSRYSAVIRGQYFQTDGYNSRVYAYENDVLYSYSIPSVSGKGLRYYLIINYNFNKKLSCWLRWARTFSPDEPSTGTGPDEIKARHRSEIKWQVRLIL